MPAKAGIQDRLLPIWWPWVPAFRDPTKIAGTTPASKDSLASAIFVGARRGDERTLLSAYLPAWRSRRRCLSSHWAITPATAALFFSIIIMWPLPFTPTSASRMSVFGAPACVR